MIFIQVDTLSEAEKLYFNFELASANYEYYEFCICKNPSTDRYKPYGVYWFWNEEDRQRDIEYENYVIVTYVGGNEYDYR